MKPPSSDRICHKCNFQGDAQQFHRKDENGEFIKSGSSPRLNLTQIDILRRIRETRTLSEKEEKEYFEKYARWDLKEFCPMCDYVEGTDKMVEDKFERVREIMHQRAYEKGLRLAQRGNGCMLTLVLLATILYSSLLMFSSLRAG